jgi:hypothetical protein
LSLLLCISSDAEFHINSIVVNYKEVFLIGSELCDLNRCEYQIWYSWPPAAWQPVIRNRVDSEHWEPGPALDKKLLDEQICWSKTESPTQNICS